MAKRIQIEIVVVIIRNKIKNGLTKTAKMPKSNLRGHGTLLTEIKMIKIVVISLDHELSITA